MSTRKLILVALLAGLAILVAGGVFLFNVARNRDQLTVTGIRAVGEVVEVGGVRAGVLRVAQDGGLLVLDVRMDTAGTTLGVPDAEDAWTAVIGRERERLAVPEDHAGLACAGRAVEPGTSLDCAVAFDAADGPAYASFSFGGDQEQWRLDR